MTKDANLSTAQLLKWFIREEWRVYTTMFGKVRFGTFPLIIFSFAVALGAAVPLFNVDVYLVALMYHVLILLFGLQTGVIGFDARDTIENVLGDTSRMLFASRTLPIEQRKLVAVFLLKDALFYAVVFLLPVVIGGVFGLVASPFEGSVLLVDSITISSVVLLYLTTVLAFVFGVSFGFMLTTVKLERLEGIVIVGLVAGGLTAFMSASGVTLSALSQIPIHLWMALMFVGSLWLVGIGLWQFKQSESIRRQPTYPNRYKKLAERVSASEIHWQIAVKNLIDIRRSAGGFWKVVFSTGVIVLTSVVLIYFIDEFMGLAPRHEFMYAGLISLISYPLYTVLFRYDSLDSYRAFPITDEDVYRAKSILFLTLGILLGIAYYTPLVAFEVSVTSYILGLFVLSGMMIYQLGLLMVIVRDKPMEFLFDGFLFSKFAAAVFVLIVPILVLGMFGQLLGFVAVTSITLAVLAAAIFGVAFILNKSTNL